MGKCDGCELKDNKIDELILLMDAHDFVLDREYGLLNSLNPKKPNELLALMDYHDIGNDVKELYLMSINDRQRILCEAQKMANKLKKYIPK